MTKEEDIFIGRLSVRDEEISHLKTIVDRREKTIEEQEERLSDLYKIARAAMKFLAAKDGEKNRLKNVLRKAVYQTMKPKDPDIYHQA